MNISTVARLTGASPKAIRNYEVLGLIPQVRRQGTYRCYSQQDVNRIRLIRIAQSLGFRLAELRTLTAAGGLPTWRGVLALVEQKYGAIQQDIQRLEQLRDQLGSLREQLQGCEEEGEQAIDLMDIDCDLLNTSYENPD